MNHLKFILEIDIVKREKGSPAEIKFVRKKEKETVIPYYSRETGRCWIT